MSDEEISLAPQRGDGEVGTTDPEIPLNNRDGSNGDATHTGPDQITESDDIDSAADDQDLTEDDANATQTQTGGEDPPYDGADYTPQGAEVTDGVTGDNNFQTITDIPDPLGMKSSLPLD